MAYLPKVGLKSEMSPLIMEEKADRKTRLMRFAVHEFAAVRQWVPFVIVFCLLVFTLPGRLPGKAFLAAPSPEPVKGPLPFLTPRAYRFTVRPDPPAVGGLTANAISHAMQVWHTRHDCSGLYTVQNSASETRPNGRPLYFNEQSSKALAFNGLAWEIIPMAELKHLEDQFATKGSWPRLFGGILTGGTKTSGENRNTPDDALWPGYTVTAETPPAFVFTSRTKGAIPATVQGAGTYTYVGDVLGAPAYLNREQNHLLGWRGDRWVVVPDSPDRAAALGPAPIYLFSAEPVARWPDQVRWEDFVVSELDPRAAPSAPAPEAPVADTRAFFFRVKPGGVNTGNCDGLYAKAQGDSTQIHGKPFYLNKEKGRVLVYTGTEWQISKSEYLPDLLISKSAPALHHGGGDWVTGGFWGAYTVSPYIPKSFKFTVRENGANLGNCDGVYLISDADDSMINGKPYYVNADREKFLAWTGDVWTIAPLHLLPSVQRHRTPGAASGTAGTGGFAPGAFGGLHRSAGRGAWPDEGIWEAYVVTGDEPANVDQRRAFSFKLKPGGNDYANCLGVYKAAVDEGEINGKPYYVNEKKGRFAAWNGEMWEITALFYLPGIKSTHLNHGYWSREFGGFHVGGGARIDDNGWKDYFVTEAVPTSFEFITKPGLMDVATCQGVYKRATGVEQSGTTAYHSPDKINGKPYFVNERNGRFLAWTGGNWEISALEYLNGVKKHHAAHGYWPGSFGGYHSGGGELADEGSWESYTVTAKWDE